MSDYTEVYTHSCLCFKSQTFNKSKDLKDLKGFQYTRTGPEHSNVTAVNPCQLVNSCSYKTSFSIYTSESCLVPPYMVKFITELAYLARRKTGPQHCCNQVVDHMTFSDCFQHEHHLIITVRPKSHTE